MKIYNEISYPCRVRNKCFRVLLGVNFRHLLTFIVHISRYDSDGIATHDKQVLAAVAATVLDDMKEEAENFSVIGIDEGQFVSFNSLFCLSFPCLAIHSIRKAGVRR